MNEFWSPAGKQANRVNALEESLVLTAVGIENELLKYDGHWQIMVRDEQVGVAVQHIKEFHKENKAAAEIQVQPMTVDSGWLGVLSFLGVIWLMPTLDAMTSIELRTVGMMSNQGILGGQWWRTVTALTLHADIAHIMANSFFGALFGLFVGRHLGSGFGWLVVLVCGALANLLNALLLGPEYRSLGSSTACFAALGLVPAFSWRNGYFRGSGWKKGFAPIFGAIAMLAFTGVSDKANTDVSGHILGFVVGLSAGLALLKSKIEVLTLKDQQRAGAFALSVIILSWLAAIP